MRHSPPNILLIMADQLTASALTAYGNPTVKAPHIDHLAKRGVVFENAYCNSPLCAPSRASMLTGRLPSEIGAYDNAADFSSAYPTFFHFLRLCGYRTCLSGKMHLIGADQLHGVEERLTTDIYPADFGWVSDWERPVSKRFSWYHNMLSVVQAGPCQRTNQVDFDEETAFQATRWLYDRARDADAQPFCLAVSFTHPHDPYAISRDFWDRYAQSKIEMPRVGPIPIEKRDPHTKRLAKVIDLDRFAMTNEHIGNARRAYYGSISFVDDQVGHLLDVLEKTGQKENTIVIFISDHGDMLGERGMWYKMSFFEGSARVPFIVHAPQRYSAQRLTENVSLIDILPTLIDMTGKKIDSQLIDTLSGHSLLPCIEGRQSGGADTVLGEYLGEGALAPIFMIKQGQYKFIQSEVDPDQLYDLKSDPDELENLIGKTQFDPLAANFKSLLAQRWDAPAIKKAVIDSQRRRRLVFEAQTVGRTPSWDHQPQADASTAYMRNTIKLDDLERRARFPRPAVPNPDTSLSND